MINKQNFSDPALYSAVFSGQDIEEAMNRGYLGVEREIGQTLHVGPSSLDIHVHPEVKHAKHQKRPVRIDDPDTYPEWETDTQETITIGPKEFCLARSDEVFDLPDDLMAILHGRSSIGRLGLFIENAGVIDRGYGGSLTLELYNATRRPIELPALTRVGQLIFFQHDHTDGAGYDGKYQGQIDPTASRAAQDDDM